MGQQVILTLAKLQPGMTKVQIDPAMATVRVTASEDGTFEGSITVAEDEGWAGEPGALVVAYTPDFSKSAVAQFTIVQKPGGVETSEPTAEATEEATPGETAEPTAEPETTEEVPATAEPTAEPTTEPEPTAEPTVEPTAEPAEPGVPLPVMSLFPISGTVGVTVTAHGEAWPAGGQVGFTLAQPVSQEGVPQVTLPLSNVAQIGEIGTFDQPIWLPGDGGWELTPLVFVIARTADGQIEVTVPYTVTAVLTEPAPPAP